MIRETGSSLTAVYLENELYCNRSLYSIIVTLISPKYILAILCSRLIQYFYQSEFKTETEIFPKIRISQVKKIPIKRATKEEQAPFIDLVDIILTKKEKGEDTTIEENKIDELVYQLYELTEEEIKIVENSITNFKLRITVFHSSDIFRTSDVYKSKLPDVPHLTSADYLLPAFNHINMN